MAKGGRYLNKAPVRRRKGGKAVFIIALILLLVIAVPVVGGAVYYTSMLNLITRPEATEVELSDEDLIEILGYVPGTLPDMEPDETKAPVQKEKPLQNKTAKKKAAEDPIVNVMLIGQHRQKGEDSKLSDTMMLCSLNKETKTLTLTSFQRDLYVKLPNYKNHECGKNRINVAYNLGWRWAGEIGGMEMLDQLIYENFGVEVDYNVEVGFDAFVEVIDVLGGVDVTLTAAEASFLQLGSAGSYHLDGETALSYARIRSIDNDFYRTNRQRNVIKALIDKAKNMSIAEMNDALKKVLPYIITDMTNDDITKLALELLPMVVVLKIESAQCPVEGTYWFDMIDIAGVESSIILCELEPNREILMEVAENVKPEESGEK